MIFYIFVGNSSDTHKCKRKAVSNHKGFFLSLIRMHKHPLFSLAILGLVIRYSLGLYTSWSNDVEIWYWIGMSILHGTGLYERMGFFYPPVWGYILGFFIKVAAFFIDPKDFAVEVPALRELSLITGMINTTITSPLFNVVFKTPLFISDLLIGLTLYKFIYDTTQDIRKAKKAFIMWFFNPLVIAVSAMHGMFDTIAVFFALLSMIFVYKGKYFLGGSAWMLGILTKIYPIYFVFAFLVFIVSASYSKEKNIIAAIRNAIRNILAFILGATLSLLLVMLPLFLSGTFDEFLRFVFAGRTIGLIVGGFSVWFIKNIPSFRWVAIWAYNNSAIVIKYSIMISLLLLCILGLYMLFHLLKVRTKDEQALYLIYGMILTLVIIYLTSPITQPQYLTWIIPFLVLYTILYNPKFKYIIYTISISGIMFYFSLESPLAFFLPLAVYTNVIHVQTVCSIIKSYWYMHGFLNTFLRKDLELISSAMGVISLLTCLYPLWANHHKI